MKSAYERPNAYILQVSTESTESLGTDYMAKSPEHELLTAKQLELRPSKNG